MFDGMTVGLLASGKAYVNISALVSVSVRSMVRVGIRFSDRLRNTIVVMAWVSSC